MKQLSFILLSALTLWACSAEKTESSVTNETPISQAPGHLHSTGPKAPAAVHGMVIFGENEIYASHIPMFMIPHDWQALFKVKLSHPSADALAVYKKARSLSKNTNGPQTLLTLKPKPFVLPPLLDGKVTTFEAALFLGNFEADGKQLLSGITVTVEKILEVHHLAEDNKALASLSYYLLKDGKKGYLVHQISAPDNFDQIFEVELPSKLSLAASNTLPVLDFGFADNLDASLKKGQSYTLSADGKLVQSSMGGDSALKVVGEFYCTLGPDFFDDCN